MEKARWSLFETGLMHGRILKRCPTPFILCCLICQCHQFPSSQNTGVSKNPGVSNELLELKGQGEKILPTNANFPRVRVWV